MRLMRKTTGMVLALGAALTLAGCGGSQMVWVKQGVDMAQAASELRGCAEQEGFIFKEKEVQAVSSEVTYAASKFDSCMTGKKFRKK